MHDQKKKGKSGSLAVNLNDSEEDSNDLRIIPATAKT